ncbi:type VI secretion system Vgr family protein [Paraburkholderia tropica]|uniref:type VI secretion system Vgr family protein n=1 Tax=Paraburkholderia tropica TaxID=92647 RepID=UPI003D2B2FC0
MQNHSDSSRERYRAPGRPMEMDGAAIPRFTPLTPREDWYWRLNPTVPQKEVTHSLLVPISLKGTESVGGLFHYTVRAKTDLRAPWTLDTALDLDAIVGTEITVSIDIPGRGTFIPGMPGNTGQGNIGFHVREITGRVSTARFIERNDRTMVYEFVLEPTLKQASMGQNYRVFQNKTVIDAIRELLADYPVSIDWRVAGPIHGGHYPVRDLQRQHFETDFTCFRRWCERAGLFFWFEHSEGFHRLIIADTMGAFHRHGEAYETLRYAPGENRVDEECIEWLELDSHWTEGKVTVVDHDPMAPRLRRSNTPLRATDHDPRETAEADQEFYEYGVNVSQPLQGAMGLNGRPLDNDEQARQAAMVRMQSIRCQGMRIRGSGHLRGLRPGYTFELTEHPLATVNQEWLVLSMNLDIECNDQASGTEQAFRCDCGFEAQPAKGCHFRLPIVTPWPVIGAERAIVTGPEGSELWTDAQGRVCVQLVADRQGKYDNDSFIWLWPAQPWQNGRASSVFLPRVGSEVVVEHINGNPDMPYVAGGLGNRDNPPPWELAKNMWLTGIRTRESGGSGSNHLVFDDTHGKQQVQLATDVAKTGAHFGHIRRVDDDTGLQEPRGFGAEVRTDGFMALRAALGGMFTTFARLLAKGKIKENGEAVALLTAARDIHENAAQLAQQRGAQEPGRDQSDAVTAIKTANDELRGSANPRAGADDFPEFERPHLLLASAAGIQAAAKRRYLTPQRGRCISLKQQFPFC